MRAKAFEAVSLAVWCEPSAPSAVMCQRNHWQRKKTSQAKDISRLSDNVLRLRCRKYCILVPEDAVAGSRTRTAAKKKAAKQKQNNHDTSSPEICRLSPCLNLAPGTAPVTVKRTHIEARNPTTKPAISTSIVSTTCVMPDRGASGAEAVVSASGASGCGASPASPCVAWDSARGVASAVSGSFLSLAETQLMRPSNTVMQPTPKKYPYGEALKTSIFRKSENASAPAKPMRCTPAI
mmetsp:Transcript_4162/g.9772  ORF Transcript_4162/g.9772 Transcript_4162/m.9772 type:complete len:237 (-) Transcript_4162:580-1290(-)